MKIKKRLIELMQFFGMAVVLVFIWHLIYAGLSSMGMFLSLFIYPITELSWNSNAQMVTPIILIFMLISLFVEHVLWRRILMGLTIVAWAFLGFMILATSITINKC